MTTGPLVAAFRSRPVRRDGAGLLPEGSPEVDSLAGRHLFFFFPTSSLTEVESARTVAPGKIGCVGSAKGDTAIGSVVVAGTGAEDGPGTEGDAGAAGHP